MANTLIVYVDTKGMVDSLTPMALARFHTAIGKEKQAPLEAMREIVEVIVTTYQDISIERLRSILKEEGYNIEVRNVS